MERDLDALQVLPSDSDTTSLLNTDTCGGPTCGTGNTCGESCTVSN
ncbi:ALQxL family class IV lanthipeptide [Streptomyces sp. MS06]